VDEQVPKDQQALHGGFGATGAVAGPVLSRLPRPQRASSTGGCSRATTAAGPIGRRLEFGTTPLNQLVVVDAVAGPGSHIDPVNVAALLGTEGVTEHGVTHERQRVIRHPERVGFALIRRRQERADDRVRDTDCDQCGSILSRSR
jgi:hypothetical protein